MKPNKPIHWISAQLHFTLFLIGGVLWWISKNFAWENSPRLSEGNGMIALALLALACFNGIVCLLWPKIFKVHNAEENSPQNFAANQPSILTELFFDFHSITPAIQTSTLIRMALAESIALFGFILSYLQQSLVFFFPFALMALLLQLLVGPFRKNIFGI